MTKTKAPVKRKPCGICGKMLLPLGYAAHMRVHRPKRTYNISGGMH